jgi:hypothetical protein
MICMPSEREVIIFIIRWHMSAVWAEEVEIRSDSGTGREERKARE